MVSTKQVAVTSRPNCIQRLFGAKPITTYRLQVDIYENYHIDPINRVPAGLTVHRNVDYRNLSGRTGNVPFRLATNKLPN